jgi:outer membrane protein
MKGSFSMKARLILVVLGSFLFTMCFAGWSFAQEKVGFINLQRLVSESKMGQKAKGNYETLRKNKEAQVAKKAEEVNALKKLISTTGDKMSQKERADKLDELEKANKELQRLVADARQDIRKQDRELVASILAQADSVLKDVAKKNKFGIILKDANAIGFLDPSVDITDKVIKELNDKAK